VLFIVCPKPVKITELRDIEAKEKERCGCFFGFVHRYM
jgi:hypothetical protein